MSILRWILLLVVAAVAALVVWRMWPERMQEGPWKVKVSPETTHITEPLRPDGSVDYAAALNAILGEGVTPENNAAGILADVFGVHDEATRQAFEDYFGVPPPAQGSFVDWDEFTGESRNGLAVVCARPTGKRRDLVAQWFERVGPSLARIEEASHRQNVHLPYPDGEGPLVHDDFHSLVRIRTFQGIAALRARATWSALQGHPEAVREDLRTALRLVAQSRRRPPLLLDVLTANLMEREVWTTVGFLAAEGLLDARNIRLLAGDISALPPVRGLAEVVDGPMRLFQLDALGCLARGGLSRLLSWFLFEPVNLPSPEVDWDHVHTEVNGWIDRKRDALRHPDRAEAMAMLTRIEAELDPPQSLNMKQSAAPAPRSGLPGRLLDAGERLLKGDRDPAAKELRRIARDPARRLGGWLIMGPTSCPALRDHPMAYRRLTLVALAIAAFRADRGRLPESLAELVPDYIDPLPLAPITGTPFLWLTTEDGHVLRYTGENGTDDGGPENGPDPTEFDIPFPR